MTKKVADLNFYAFVELYRILKEKFEGFHFDTSSLGEEISYFIISLVPSSEVEEFEIVIEIHEPLSKLLCASDSNLDSFDLDKGKIMMNIYLYSVSSLSFYVDKVHFDNPDFILKLSSLIGTIAPIRRKGDGSSKNAQKWLEEKIKKEGIEQYLGFPA